MVGMVACEVCGCFLASTTILVSPMCRNGAELACPPGFVRGYERLSKQVCHGYVYVRPRTVWGCCTSMHSALYKSVLCRGQHYRPSAIAIACLQGVGAINPAYLCGPCVLLGLSHPFPSFKCMHAVLALSHCGVFEWWACCVDLFVAGE